MNKLVLAETKQHAPVRQLLVALDAEFEVSPLESILADKKRDGSALILSEAKFVELCKAALARKSTFNELISGFRNVLVYPFSGTAESLKALAGVVKGEVSVRAMAEGIEADYIVRGAREMCGPFTDLRVEGIWSSDDRALRFEGAAPHTSIVAGRAGSLFTRFELPGVNLFVASTTAVFDTSAEYVRNLDVRECFSGLMPLLFFLRHCKINIPETPLRWANWIIDDPNLRPRYGFLDVKELVSCVRELGAAASIAFIPWNHKRTAREIVGLFRENWPQLSICIHGCDHTGAEFSTKTMSAASPLIDLAMKRMQELKTETDLDFERIMVFPQGRFSGEAMRALRASEMLAAVNTELLDCQTGHGVKGWELLRPAITSFGGFPLFLRRPAEEPAANFALDMILGKPCLIVTHHPYFSQGLKPLRSVVETLNAMEPELTWTNLEQGISSTYSVRKNSGEKQTIRLYSPHTVFHPKEGNAFFFKKPETEPVTIETFVDGTPVDCSRANGEVEFSIPGAGRKTMTVETFLAAQTEKLWPAQSRKYRLKVTARRYLTEVRDNYLHRFPRLTAHAASLQQLLHRGQ